MLRIAMIYAYFDIDIYLENSTIIRNLVTAIATCSKM